MRPLDPHPAWRGSNAAFGSAVFAVVFWGACGPVFAYSETWQLVINTSTTIITFLIVFLLQRSQNKESRAVQLKLNEVIAALKGASNRMIGAEGLSEAELEQLSEAYSRLAASCRGGAGTESHTIEEEHGAADSRLTAR